MQYPIPLSEALQWVVAIGVNVVAIAWLFWPLLRLRWHFRRKSTIPFRARLGALIIFLIAAGAFWSAFLWFDQWAWNTPGREWMHVFLSRWTLPIDVASFIALPAYMYELLFSKNHRGHHHIFGKIMWVTLWVVISFGVTFWLGSQVAIKGLVGKML